MIPKHFLFFAGTIITSVLLSLLYKPSTAICITLLVAIIILGFVALRRKSAVARGVNNLVYFNSKVDQVDLLVEKKDVSPQPRINKSLEHTEDGGSSIPYYEKHLVVLTSQNYTDWDKHIDREGFLESLRVATKKHKDNRFLITVAEHIDGEVASNDSFSVLIFPDRRVVDGINANNVDEFVTEFIINCRRSKFKHNTLQGTHVLVNCHTKCHHNILVNGPRLAAHMIREMQSYPGANHVTIRRSSDLRAHDAEGTLIIYRPFAQQKKVFGDWYWNVSADNVTELIEKHILKGDIVKHLWRGRGGMTPAITKQFLKFQTN
ncbi:ferredoxin, 2Fe-2S [Acrasis kona]|uniref:Ferredoxin, 2Fe-2S n=1 Tax=Acrasis kona TaxID=1008807 RepID=A0AAW2ZIH5_9EUKA